jgi:Rad3-related DNA helicase
MKTFRLPAMNKDLAPLINAKKKRYLKHFRHKNFRPSQLESITLIGQLLDDGFENIIFSAPTGSGKSDIGMTICEAYHHGKNWNYGMLSSQINLMKQYKADFPSLEELKGRRNFACDIEPCTAADAPCAKMKNFKCDIDVFDDGKRIRNCGYFRQKRTAAKAKGYVSNPWYVFLETAFSQSTFRGRDLAIFDEAHNIENILVEQLQETWTQKNHDFVWKNNEMMFPNYAEAWSKLAGDENAWTVYFAECSRGLSETVKEIKAARKAGRKNEELNTAMLYAADLKNKLNKLKDLLREPYSILAEVKSTRYGRTASFKPLDVKAFSGEIFDRIAKHRIFMSATIDAKLFVKTMGLDPEKCAFIELTQSNFPLEHRKVYTKNVSKLDFHSGFRNAVPKIGEFIRGRLLKHEGENVMVYAPSFDLCNKLAKYLSPYHRKILTHDSSTRDKVVKKFIEGPERGYLLFTPSLTEGYDLKGDICRLLIVVKIPYGSLGDTLVTRRMLMHEREWRDEHEGSALCPYEPPQNGALCSNYACHKPCQSHYRAQAAFKMVQVIGRGVRSSDDFCETWIIDSGWSNFLRTAHDYMPKWFLDGLEKV